MAEFMRYFQIVGLGNVHRTHTHSSHQLINRLVLKNNVAASTIQPKHVLFAIIRSVFHAINQNWFIEIL